MPHVQSLPCVHAPGNERRAPEPPSNRCASGWDGADQETAEILQGLIRNIEYSSQADVAYDTALEHAVGGGFGYFRICTDYAAEDMFEQDICMSGSPTL